MISTLAVLGAYLAGSVPFGLFVTRLVSGRDVRTVGSGNIGATNVARAAGPTAALSTLLLDGAKGFVPAYFATKSADSTVLGAACGVAAVVGHCFPVWLRFRGGKGVATGLGVALALAPLAAVAGAVVWLAAYAAVRISSVGSLAGAAAALVCAGVTANRPAFFAMTAIACLIAIRHRTNV
ncbi:MAG: glycerol-3-phosphate 1-O-acyltransferase PlsY, partial [Myxococcales bacterium]